MLKNDMLKNDMLKNGILKKQAKENNKFQHLKKTNH